MYLGLWLFMSQYKDPVISKGSLLGITFAVAFLTSVEGLLYIGVIPFSTDLKSIGQQYGGMSMDYQQSQQMD